MSKFAYNSEGELNSQYLLDLLKEYLSKILEANDTNGIVEDEYNINPNSNAFVRWFKHTTKRMFKNPSVLDNYNKVLSTKYTNNIMDKLDIFLKTNVLEPSQIWNLKQTLQAIHFDKVLPLIDINRESAIKSSQKKFLKVLGDIKYLSEAKINYVLYNSPVEDIKPFLTEKVSTHTINYIELQKLVRHFVELRYKELTTFNFNPIEVDFVAKRKDFYKDSITDNGIGEEVEQFIRSKMLEKLEILSHEENLPEDINLKIEQIDVLLKKLKLSKIEKMMQQLIDLKTNLANAKEVMDKCKDTINSTTIPNKDQIFLVMDNLYYKLSKKCELLEQTTKSKLQLVDKQKMFNLLQTLENQSENNTYTKVKTLKLANTESLHTSKTKNNLDLYNKTDKPGIASNLYDDDEDSEIHVDEDISDDNAEDEIIIDEDKQH